MTERPLVATYRLQLQPDFTFADATAAVPFLAELGISHLYLSPVLQAARGSTHGYDVVDVERLSAELGGAEGFDALRTTAHHHGLGLVVDLVPHHLAIGDRANRWWWEVLTYGEAAPHAHYFDVDWHAPEARLRNKVVLPVLEDHVGRAVDDGTISVVTDADELFVVRVGEDLVLPLSPATVGELVLAVSRDVADDQLGAVARALVDAARGAGRTADELVVDDQLARRRARGRLEEVDADSAAPDRLLTRLSS